MLSMQDGLQPGLKCVAMDMVGANPFPNISSKAATVCLWRSMLKFPVR